MESIKIEVCYCPISIFINHFKDIHEETCERFPEGTILHEHGNVYVFRKPKLKTYNIMYVYAYTNGQKVYTIE